MHEVLGAVVLMHLDCILRLLLQVQQAPARSRDNPWAENLFLARIELAAGFVGGWNRNHLLAAGGMIKEAFYDKNFLYTPFHALPPAEKTARTIQVDRLGVMDTLDMVVKTLGQQGASLSKVQEGQALLRAEVRELGGKVDALVAAVAALAAPSKQRRRLPPAVPSAQLGGAVVGGASSSSSPAAADRPATARDHLPLPTEIGQIQSVEQLFYDYFVEDYPGAWRAKVADKSSTNNKPTRQTWFKMSSTVQRLEKLLDSPVPKPPESGRKSVDADSKAWRAKVKAQARAAIAKAIELHPALAWSRQTVTSFNDALHQVIEIASSGSEEKVGGRQEGGESKAGDGSGGGGGGGNDSKQGSLDDGGRRMSSGKKRATPG
jgi:hypothetical protein